MGNIKELSKRLTCAIVTLALVLTGMGFTKIEAAAASGNGTALSGAYVYYVSNGALFRAKSDGTSNQKLLSSFEGVNLKPAGNYLYYMYDEKSTTFLSLPLDGSKKMATRFIDDDILYYDTDGTNIYYMNDKGEIYVSPANAKSDQAKLVTDMADTNYPRFSIVNGKVYYNALKSGRNTWVAAKAADGSGQVQWVTAGAFLEPWFTHKDASNIYMMVNTKPTETRYSTKCMVLACVPMNGGSPKVLNAKTPLDYNAVYSGQWTNDYFIYNDKIAVKNGKYDYSKANAFAIDMKGKSIKLHTKGIVEIADFGAGKLAFVDSDSKAYVSTIASGKATSKAVSIKDAWYIRNLASTGKTGATVLFTKSGVYTLQANLSLKKLIGIEWDLCMYDDSVDGLFYVNAGDNSRLYYLGSDGATNIKVSDEKVKDISLISNY
jgi:hypothetical protein